YCDYNDRDIEVKVCLPQNKESTDVEVEIVKSVTIKLRRGTAQYTCATDPPVPSPEESSWQINGTSLKVLNSSGSPRTVDLSNVFDVFKVLAKTMYVPSFRNPIQHFKIVRHEPKHYDAVVGEDFVTAWSSFAMGPSVRNRRTAENVVKDIKKVF